MSLLGRLRGSTPFSNDPALNATGPLNNDQLLGHTPTPPDPGTLRPRVGVAPIGASGRANFYGLPQWDELNKKLTGVQGLRLLDEMYRTDAHLRRLVLAAWSPVVAGSWTLEPYGGEDATEKDRKIADAIWWLLTEWMSPSFTEHLSTLGPILMRFGFAPFEQTMWGTVKHDGQTLLAPKKLDVRMPWSVWRWWQDDFGELTHIGQILPNRADVVIEASDLVYYRLAAEGDNWMGMSLLRQAYKHWYLKDKFERLDAVGQERRAVGVPVVYHSPDIDPQVLNGLEQALANMHMSEVAYLMVPGFKMGDAPADAPGNQFLIDVIQYDSSSGPGIQQSIDYHQTAISASFLTDFLELGHHQVGARATAEVQEDPFLTAINGALLPPVIPPLNRFIDRLRKLNWDSEGSPKLKLTLTDQASLSEIATYVQQLVGSEAMQVDDDLEDWLRNYAGLPAANSQARDQRHAEEAAMKDQQAAAAAAQAAQAADPNPDEPPPTGAKPGQDVSPAAKPGQPKPTPVKPTPAKQLDAAPAPVAGGLIVHAADTGRVLIAKRTPDDTDEPDVFAGWEFPGGKLDGGPDGQADRSAWAGAQREWEEETGATLPGNARRAGDFVSPDGAYHAFVVQIPHETDLQLGQGDRAEVSHVDWRHPGSLPSVLSDRAQRLLPALQRILDPDDDGDDDLSATGDTDHDARTLDATAAAASAPLSGGTTTGDGLQMVPDIPGAGTGCSCDAGYENGHCRECGAPEPGHAHLLDNAAAEPPAKWFEALLSQDRLREAIDGCRDHIQAACEHQVRTVARQMAHQAANGTPMTNTTPPPELVDALTGHYQDLFTLGHRTVVDELGRQRAALGRTLLDDPTDTSLGGAVGSRVARARQRGEHSARNIVAKINERLGRDQITALKQPAALQAGAEQAAIGQLRVEALANTAAQLNDGRNTAGTSASDVVGAYYTSVLDERSCDNCEKADDGVLLTPDQAVALGPPNPMCDGRDFCRCMLVWVLSSDPAALAAA